MKIDFIRIETPEKISFSYHIASVGTRITAYTIDIIIQGAVMVLVYLLILAVAGSTVSFGMEFLNEAGFFAIAFYYLISFFLQWGYFMLFEAIMNGQSPGKKAMRIRVIRSNGEPLDFPAIVIRNLLRAVDGFPTYSISGGIAALIDRKTRRLGDIVSDTLVVNEIVYNLKEPVFETNLSAYAMQGEPVLLPAGKRLSENELFILRRFINERGQIPPDKQQTVARNLASQIIKKLNLKQDLDKILDSVVFIEQVYKEHTHENN